MIDGVINRDDRRAGTIEVGKDADLVIASDHPLTSDNLASIRVEAIMVRGSTAFRR